MSSEIAQGHRRTSTRLGLGATAAAVLAVGVLVTTAANAGGITPPSGTIRPAIDTQNSSGTGTRTGPGRGAPALGYPVDGPMRMTLLSVPSARP